MIVTLAKLRELTPDKGRRQTILAIALPIIGGMLSQNILNLVDTAMVGHLGDVALAAAGYGGFASFMSAAIVMGLAAGVQALSARRLGEGRDSVAAVPLNGGLMLSVLLGVPLSLALYQAAPWIMSILTPDPAVVESATPYLQIRLLATVAIGMNFCFRGYLSAVHMTRYYLMTIVTMHIINVTLNWVLIFGNLGSPVYGVTGAAMATSISLVIGTMMYFVIAWRVAHQHGFLHRLPSRKTLWQQVKLSLPNSFQQLMFSAGLVMLLYILGRIGTAEVAAGNVLLNIMLVSLLPAMGLGMATSTLVGNALGRNDVADARRWGWNGAMLTGVYGVAVMLILALIGHPFLSIFLTNPETLELAYIPLMITAAIIAIDLMGIAMMSALLGAGDTMTPMRISIIGQWLFFLPLAWLVGPILGYGLLGVWLIQAIYRLAQAIMFICTWHRGEWGKIKI
ncbi:MAG: MATE family efflux transporter [Xanthomonadales bacterium]|nr:MATE family efflux transporter [Xanthomonadales bacterium]